MAVKRMLKVLISGYSGELEGFMDQLQKASILHIRKPEEIIPASGDEEAAVPESALVRELESAKEFLDSFSQKPGFLESISTPVKKITEENFHNVIISADPADLIEKTSSLRKKISQLRQEKENLIKESAELEFWKEINIRIPEKDENKTARFFCGIMPAKNLSKPEINDIAEISILNQDENKTAILAACHISRADELRDLLTSSGFEEPQVIPGKHTSFSQQYQLTLSRLEEIELQVADSRNEASSLISKYESIEILLEHHLNLDMRNRALALLQKTQRSFLLGGWLRADDREKLNEIATAFDSIEIFEVPLSKGESPPVELTNPKPFSPFELITSLYSTPSYRSFDPSSYLALFFAVFFGITLTDAGYGIILSILAVILLRKTVLNRNILKIMFLGGIFTVFAGLLTGGIFGDLFRAQSPFVNMPFLISIRENLMWFDPMKDPMIFFRLVLFLGTVHITAGMFLGLFSNIRNREYLSALVDNGSWIIILFSLLYLFFSTDLCIKTGLVSGNAPIFSGMFSNTAIALTAVSSALIVLFGARDEESVFFRFFVGFLKLVVLSGIFSYLGDILSYIRLMALGMVTAGIAMAINTIVFMTADIPYAGYIIAAIIFTAGHTFNLAINLLGGFVHTLRLQYVEFFSKFFTGGGVEFKPLSYSSKYRRIID